MWKEKGKYIKDILHKAAGVIFTLLLNSMLNHSATSKVHLSIITIIKTFGK